MSEQDNNNEPIWHIRDPEEFDEETDVNDGYPFLWQPPLLLTGESVGRSSIENKQVASIERSGVFEKRVEVYSVIRLAGEYSEVREGSYLSPEFSLFEGRGYLREVYESVFSSASFNVLLSFIFGEGYSENKREEIYSTGLVDNKRLMVFGNSLLDNKRLMVFGQGLVADKVMEVYGLSYLDYKISDIINRARLENEQYILYNGNYTESYFSGLIGSAFIEDYFSPVRGRGISESLISKLYGRGRGLSLLESVAGDGYIADDIKTVDSLSSLQRELEDVISSNLVIDRFSQVLSSAMCLAIEDGVEASSEVLDVVVASYSRSALRDSIININSEIDISDSFGFLLEKTSAESTLQKIEEQSHFYEELQGIIGKGLAKEDVSEVVSRSDVNVFQFVVARSAVGTEEGQSIAKSFFGNMSGFIRPRSFIGIPLGKIEGRGYLFLGKWVSAEWFVKKRDLEAGVEEWVEDDRLIKVEGEWVKAESFIKRGVYVN